MFPWGRSFGSVVKELVQGLEDGSLILPQQRMQGPFDWKEFWSRLTGSAAELRLRSVRLDVNVPAIDKGYHASWVRSADGEEDVLWRVVVPLASRGRVVGRLDMTGGRAEEECVSVKIAALGRFVTELESVVEELVRARDAKVSPRRTATPTVQPPPNELVTPPWSDWPMPPARFDDARAVLPSRTK